MTQQPIPFLDLVTSHRELEEELVAAFRTAVRSARFIGGPEVEGFEQEFADYCGSNFSVGVSSGTDALRFALLAIGVGHGDAVLTVSHTFLATVEAINQTGAVTEFVDVDEATYTMSPAALSEYLKACPIEPSTGRPLALRSKKPIKAIVPVHLYGHVADMGAIASLAAQYNLVVVEDACQAHGAEYFDESAGDWRRAGSLAKAAAFSFYPGKNLGACGEAGAVTTNDEAVAARVRMLRDHGQATKYYHDIEGYNGRLDAIQAAFLRVKLRHLERWTETRRANAATYDLLLKDSGVTTPRQMPYARHVYCVYAIRTPHRDALAEALTAAGIQHGIHYPIPIHLQQAYRDARYGEGSFPVAERIAREVLSLPLYPELQRSQIEEVCEVVSRKAFAISS